MTAAPQDPGEALLADAPVALEDVVDRTSLDEVCQSVHSLFGIGVRVYSAGGALLANASPELEACRYINTFGQGRAACGTTVSGAKNVDPGDAGDIIHPCFSGLQYRIITLDH